MTRTPQVGVAELFPDVVKDDTKPAVMAPGFHDRAGPGWNGRGRWVPERRLPPCDGFISPQFDPERLAGSDDPLSATLDASPIQFVLLSLAWVLHIEHVYFIYLRVQEIDRTICHQPANEVPAGMEPNSHWGCLFGRGLGVHSQQRVREGGYNKAQEEDREECQTRQPTSPGGWRARLALAQL